MIRRFGWNDVYQAAGEDQAAKVLVNIKKRKERAKRKRAREDDDEEEVEEVGFFEHLSFIITDDLIQATKGKVPTGDAFEDVLYGSESELDDSDEDEQVSRPTAGPKRKGIEQGVRLRVDDDEPMDLLQGVASRLTSGCSSCAWIYIVYLFYRCPSQPTPQARSRCRSL
jgi:ribosomal RNA-processing protein 12